MAENKEDAASEAKSLAKEAINSFGLIELVIGGVGLYGLWLFFRPEQINSLFPKTGYAFVDIGLLGFVAVLLGKIVYLFSSVLAGIGFFILERGREEGEPDDAQSGSYYKQLKSALALHTETQTDAEAVKKLAKKDETQLAQSILISASNNYAVEIAQVRNKFLIAYSAVLLLIPYYFYIIRTPENIYEKWLVLILAVIFLFMGFFQQRRLMKDMGASLVALHLSQKQRIDEAKAGER